ncbi:MAG: DNA mismatch repair protein MutT [Prevotella sp.]|jgi:ADP-ribose pyrophosphatase YjhB (NUDIX family)|nr:DNA mismatch repair protein MutT [Prevotella sp.]MCH3985223.1 DNA mismatch repair protein MutT [Prevotella sp.]MCH3992010.1 DNA mismatch repair protein MutT [Prevotella sp.]MCH4017417.1 DNA mismatch repair protein MutT [Prevotella sp.]MCH4099613.1 DNA mismatch repair protein MutT [Prevotella sp.]
MKSYYGEHSKVLVSVDCIVLGFETKHLKLLIGKRQMDPGRGEWSLYGRFVGSDESLEEAANKDLLELTGLNKIYMRQVGAYGAINRDPGERVISIAYCALINAKDYDDKLRRKYGLEWVDLENMPLLYSDHNLMVRDTILMLRRHINTEPLIFNLLPNLFTLTQLQSVYEAILDEKIDKRNFRNRIKQFDFVEKTGLIDKLTSKRGAALYRFNKRIYLEDPTFKL